MCGVTPFTQRTKQTGWTNTLTQWIKRPERTGWTT